MDIRYFELRAANKDCKEKFSDVAKKKYAGVPIFEHACNYVNNSQSYKRTGRHLEIIEIGDYYIKVKLTSESKLEMASKSLAGFRMRDRECSGSLSITIPYLEIHSFRWRN